MFLKEFFFLARQKIKYGPFIESSDMMNPIGCNSDQLKNIMQFCGLESLNLGDNKKLFFFKLKKQNKSIKKMADNKKGIIKIMNLTDDGPSGIQMGKKAAKEIIKTIRKLENIHYGIKMDRKNLKLNLLMVK